MSSNEPCQPTIKEEDVDNDIVVNQWLKFCAIDPESKPNQIEWFKQKQEFWKKNEAHLGSKGFNFNSSIVNALDTVKAELHPNMEGSLLIFKIGSNERPAGLPEIDAAYKQIDQALDGVKGIRVMVTHHLFSVEKISLPQLRNLQSSVLSSCEPGDSGDTIIKMEL